MKLSTLESGSSLEHRLRWILATALVIRLAWSVLLPIDPVSDSLAYHEFAQSITAGRGYAYSDGSLTSYWPVGTAGLYAAVYAVFGESWEWIEALNVLLGVALAWLTYRLGAIWFSARIGALAAAIVAVWPMLVQFTTILASELPFTVLVMMVCVQFFTPDQKRWRLPLAGLCLGAACLIRPTAMALFLVLPALEALQGRAIPSIFRRGLTLLVVTGLVISPWAIRNSGLYGSPVLVSTNFGPNLWMGNNPESQGAYMPLPEGRNFANELDRDRRLRAEALTNIRSDPYHYLVVLSLKRFLITHDRETIGVVWNERGLKRAGLSGVVTPLKVLSSAYWWLAASLALCGAWVLRRSLGRGLFHPLLTIAAMFVAIPTLTVGQDRYHFPVVPLVAILSAIAIIRWLDRRDGARVQEGGRL